MAAGHILVADDDAAIRTVLSQALTRAGYEVRVTGTAGTLWRWVQAGEGELVITDVVMPDEPRARPSAPKTEEIEGMPLVGRSPAMQEIYRTLARLMQTDLTVMITGESGTGKELVARALHDYGKRREGPFVAINMAAIPRDLIESELFGHEKGAFTGANARSAGRFEQAEGGTLFLDEIGDMPMEAQTRLLRVLQQGEYTTVGGRTHIKTNVRIVAATNKDLRILIQQGLFREDLFFRLNVVPLRLPPLRERTEDIPDLVRHFFKLAAAEGLPQKHMEGAAMERMKRYRWPGNIRELENLIRRLAALYPQELVTDQLVEAELGHDAPLASRATNVAAPAPALAASSAGTAEEDSTLMASVEHHLTALFKSHGELLPPILVAKHGWAGEPCQNQRKLYGDSRDQFGEEGACLSGRAALLIALWSSGGDACRSARHFYRSCLCRLHADCPNDPSRSFAVSGQSHHHSDPFGHSGC